MIVVPDSDIILIKSPLKLDNYNQITFNNATSQYNYFIGLPHLEYDGCTYQRKDGVIRYATGDNLRFEDLLEYNYCMYKNDSYKDKWFYAFVTDIKYINDGMSEVTIETDVFGTWQFDLIYMNSFIEREHVSNDTIGANTLHEDLETGEYIIQNHIKHNPLINTQVVLGSTRTPGELIKMYGGVYNGIFSGITYFGPYGNETRPLTGNDVNSLQSVIQTIENQYPDSIKTIFIAPANLCQGTGLITNSSQPVETRETITPISTIDGYTPKNNKLLTFPYVGINMSNGQGSSNVYKQELFTKDSNGKLRFQIESCLTPGCSIRCYPIYYKGEALPYEEAITLGKYPELNWTTDTYTNWLTQNGVNNAVEIGEGLIKIAGASTIAGPSKLGGAVALSGAKDILGTMTQIYQHSFSPITSKGNINCGDVVTANNCNTFHWYLMTIKREYAEIIDRYFDLYGYRVNRLGNINIHKRLNWDYIKCIDVNIEGNVPEKDLDKIRSLFNNGCTFWHNTNTFLDYSQTNSIL